MNQIVKILIAMFLIAISIIATSQELTQSISGTVKDVITDEPLPGANIVIIGSSPVIGTTTDIDGKFKLENIPVGNVSLMITYVGYKPVEILNRDLRPGKTLILNILMDEMVVSGQEVEIVGKLDKRGTINSQTSVSTRTFSVDETRRYAGSRGDVARMASNYAGVQVASDSRNDIVIRGNSPSGVQWKLDGMEIPNPNHYGAFGSTGGPVSILNNNQLENSDFLTSAFPAEYGNSLAGVFDLRLKNGNPDEYEFMGMIGFNGFEIGAEGPFSKNSDASFIGNYRYSTMEIFDLIGMDFGTGTAVPKYQDFSFKVNVPTKKAGTFSVFGMGGKSEIEFLDSKRDTNEVDFYGGEGWDLYTGSEMMVVGFNHQISINKSAVVKTGLSFSHHHYWVEQDSIVATTKDIVPYYYSDFKENRIQLNTSLRKRINVKNNFQLGIAFNHYINDLHDSVFMETNNDFMSLTDYNGTSDLIRPYLMWQYKANNNLTFNIGVDYMLYTFNSTSSLEPRAGIIYQINEGSKLSFAYGLHSQILPATTYNRESYIGNNQYATMNKDLDLQKSHHFVLGYDHYFNQYLRIKSEIYYQYIFDAAVNAHEKDTYSLLNQGADFYIWNPDTLESTGTGTNYGLELTAEHFLKNGFYFLATGSLFESKYKGSDGIERNTAFNTNFVTNLLAGKEWELKSKKSKKKSKVQQWVVGGDLKLNWAGGRRYTPIDEEQSKIEHKPVYITDETYDKKFPNYFRTDIKVYYKVRSKKSNYEFGIDVQNIFNNQNIYSQNFNTSTGEIYYTYQLGIMVIPYFRIEF
jgi:hypothetical protein